MAEIPPWEMTDEEALDAMVSDLPESAKVSMQLYYAARFGKAHRLLLKAQARKIAKYLDGGKDGFLYSRLDIIEQFIREAKGESE